MARAWESAGEVPKNISGRGALTPSVVFSSRPAADSTRPIAVAEPLWILGRRSKNAVLPAFGRA